MEYWHIRNGARRIYELSVYNTARRKWRIVDQNLGCGTHFLSSNARWLSLMPLPVPMLPLLPSSICATAPSDQKILRFQHRQIVIKEMEEKRCVWASFKKKYSIFLFSIPRPLYDCRIQGSQLDGNLERSMAIGVESETL